MQMYKYLFTTLPSIVFEVESLDQIVILFLVKNKIPYHFPQQVYHFTFPLTIYRGFNFSTSDLKLIFYIFDNSHPKGYDCYFILVFFFFFLPHPQHVEVPGPGNPHHSSDSNHSSFLTHCTTRNFSLWLYLASPQ